MDLNDKLAMYEALAIAEEKQAEIDKLTRENNELTEKLKELGQKTTGKSAEDINKKLDKVLEAVNKLNFSQKQVRLDLNNLQHRFDRKFGDLASKIEVIQNTLTLPSDLASSAEGSLSSYCEKNLESEPEKAESEPNLSCAESSKRKNWGFTLGPNSPGLARLSRIYRENFSWQKEKKTILVLGIGADNRGMAVLSQDRSKWILLQLKLPKDTAPGGGVVCLNRVIYTISSSSNAQCLQKLDKNLKWIQLASMHIGRTGITNTLEWNGFIWVLGGRRKEDLKYLNSVERYEPKVNKWAIMPQMKYPRYNAAATVWKDKIIICGGKSSDRKILQNVECFDPMSGVWTELSDMPTPLFGHSLVTYGDKLIVLRGHENPENSPSILELDSLEEKSKWKETNSCSYVWLAALNLDNQIFALGGRSHSDTASNRVQRFDGAFWRAGPSLPEQSTSLSTVLIPQTLADTFQKDFPFSTFYIPHQ